MKYSDGSDIMLGDEVIISKKYKGMVVANIDNPEEAGDWAYLESGVMIDTDFGGLVHYKQESLINEEILLKSRKS